MTFSLTCIAWIFFRANSLFEAFNYIQNIGQFNLKIDYLNIERYAVEALLLVGFFVFIEWFNKDKEEPLSGRFSTFKLVTCVLLIFMLGSFSQPQEFIYFQF